MKILVIGHSVEDHIHINKDENIKPGGIYYSALGFSKIINPNDEIHLLTALQKDNEHLFFDVYDKIIQKNINWVKEIPTVHLFINDSEERAECYETIPQNLEIDYNSLKSFDGIFINMISGFDVALRQLQEIRKHFTGPIYLDVHTLSRGVDESKTRSFRQIPSFNEWAASVDIIQANESEAKTLFGYQDDLQTAKAVLNNGIKCLIITKSSNGARIYYKRNDELESLFKAADKIETVNKVGCGDIFGSVFFYYYLKTRNIIKCLGSANKAAANAASVKIVNELSL